MLVTVSGMVGSGKSTAARHVVAALERNGVAAETLRFQSLAGFGPLASRRNPAVSTAASGTGASRGVRWAGYRRRRLTPWRTLGYIGRIAAFRIFRLRYRSRAIVLNRYFYDSLVHYRLQSRGERMMAALLAGLIPRPDVAILMTASLDTIRTRRPEYSAEYLASVHDGYNELKVRFPDLIDISSDGAQGSAAAAIDALFASGAQRDATKNRV